MGELWKDRNLYLGNFFCSCFASVKKIINYKIYLTDLNDIVIKGICSECKKNVARYLERGENEESYAIATRIKKMQNKKIAIIGCGNLDLSILNGLLVNPLINPKNISVTKRNIECLKYLEKKGIDVSSNNNRVIKKSDIIIFALKPYNILEILSELKDEFNAKKHIIISLATGISIEKIQENTSSSIPVFRAMQIQVRMWVSR